METLLTEIRNCTVCEKYLTAGCRPVMAAHPDSRLVLIGQAPGLKVHESGVPWQDASGRRLRDWLEMGEEDFYNPTLLAIIPMGFCYPGKGKSGDLPPRPECAPLWHEPLWQALKAPKLTLLIGQYAQRYYLKDRRKKQSYRNRSSFSGIFAPLFAFAASFTSQWNLAA